MFPERERERPVWDWKGEKNNKKPKKKKKSGYFVGGVSPEPARANICYMLVWTLYHLGLKRFYETLQKVLEYPISDDMVGLGKCHLPGWSPNFSCLLANDIYFNNSSETERPLLFPLPERITRNPPVAYSHLWNLCVVVAKECFLSRVDLKI